MKYLVLFLGLVALSSAQFDPHFWSGRNGIVHLFEWRWTDIARECETFLAPYGYAGVQISPPNENVVIAERPWWERYQPVSYKLETRSGNEAAFADMTRRCNAVGVRIYSDVVLNHMSSANGFGTGGSAADNTGMNWPAVPYSPIHFNPRCDITDWWDLYKIRNCWMAGLADLDQGNDWVRDKIVDFLNHLIDLGVAGFRVDAMNHMWPADMEIILGRLHNLNTNFGFSANSRAFFANEIVDLGDTATNKYDYTHLGTITEFRYCMAIGRAFRGGHLLSSLRNFGTDWGFAPSHLALTFIDNHGK